MAIEAIDKKRGDLVEELHRETPDLVKIQLILQGSISAQVHYHRLLIVASMLMNDSILIHRSCISALVLLTTHSSINAQAPSTRYSSINAQVMSTTHNSINAYQL